MSARQKSTLKVVALCLVCALVGGLAHPVYNAVTGGNGTTIYTGNRTPTKVDTAAVNTEKELTTAEIYAKYVSSCVGITVDIVSTNIFGQTVTGAAAGSGFGGAGHHHRQPLGRADLLGDHRHHLRPGPHHYHE